MNDICFVVAPQNVGWILDRICKEISQAFNTPIFSYSSKNLPKAQRYFLSHYSMLSDVMAQVNPQITPVTVFVTHESIPFVKLLNEFNLCASVICESRQVMDELIQKGVDTRFLHFVPECSNPEIFKPHARENGKILICGKNYSTLRKNPKLINEVAKLLPSRSFICLGPEWDRDINAPNVSFIWELGYDHYPEVYADCDVYLSCSTIEGGGPNSLIEAMHSNMVPVVSDVGNARDYIVDGYNGFIFGLDATAEEVALLIQKAYSVHIKDSSPYNDIWQTVRNFTWNQYRIQMKEAITGDYSLTTSQELSDEDTSN